MNREIEYIIVGKFFSSKAKARLVKSMNDGFIIKAGGPTLFGFHYLLEKQQQAPHIPINQNDPLNVRAVQGAELVQKPSSD